MTRWLRQEGRNPFGTAPILDYLWRCSIEAMNLSLLYQGKDLERELVAAELVM
jgi:vacuolar-type H+-ATPase subunit C/Vma6